MNCDLEVTIQADVTSWNLDFYEYEIFEDVLTRLPYFVEQAYKRSIIIRGFTQRLAMAHLMTLRSYCLFRGYWLPPA